MIISHQEKKERFWELDFLRGIAVLAMIIFHIFFFINFFGLQKISIFDGGWKIFARFIQWSFLLLVGIGIHLSYQHHLKTEQSFFIYFKKIVKRSLIVFFSGMLVTLFTGIFFPQDIIIFGVLHFIAVTIFFLGIFVAQYPKATPILAFIWYLVSFWINTQKTKSLFLVPIGFHLPHFRTFDYFPIFPWMAVPLFGIFLGTVFYPCGMRRFYMKLQSQSFFVSVLLYFGRYALIIYLTHVPLIVAFLTAIKYLL